MADQPLDPGLAAIQAALEGYPDPRYRARLRERLERSIEMTTMAAAQAVIPYVMTQEIEPVIDFVKRAFGAIEVERATGGAGGIHCELKLGSSRLMFGGAVPAGGVTPRRLGFHLFVDDVDAVYGRAMAAGARSLAAPEQRPYGERSAFLDDPGGNRWYVATRTGPSYFSREPRTVVPHLYVQRTAGRGAPEFIAFLEAAFGASVELRHDAGGRVMHAVLRIQDEAIELGEGDEPGLGAPAAFCVYVGDCDGAYEQALRAGARALFAPAVQPFGGRMGGVADPWGNEWYLAARQG